MDNPVSPKVTATAAAGAATLILVYLIHLLFNVDIPETVASAITLVIAVVAGFIKNDPLREAGRHEALRGR